MTSASRPERILLITGMSGAGKTTALKTFEDLGWEVVDNLPLPLLDRLLGTAPAEGAADNARPLALGIDSRTRDFNNPALASSIFRDRDKESAVGVGVCRDRATVLVATLRHYGIEARKEIGWLRGTYESGQGPNHVWVVVPRLKLALDAENMALPMEHERFRREWLDGYLEDGKLVLHPHPKRK